MGEGRRGGQVTQHPAWGGQRGILAGPARRCRQLGIRPELVEDWEASRGREARGGEGGGMGQGREVGRRERKPTKIVTEREKKEKRQMNRERENYR